MNCVLCRQPAAVGEYCRSCRRHKIRPARYRERNREKLRRKTSEYRKTVNGRAAKQRGDRRQTEKRRMLKKIYLFENKYEIEKKRKEKEIQKREKEKEYRRKYYKKNKERFIDKILKRYAERLKNDPAYRVKFYLRKRLRSFLSASDCKLRSVDLFGCTPAELREHIEAQFQEGMNWANHGVASTGQRRWHLDHIIPCAMFDLRDQAQARACFNWRNIRPLWAAENLSKRARIGL